VLEGEQPAFQILEAAGVPEEHIVRVTEGAAEDAFSWAVLQDVPG
jgi:hypothetical protein